jgi:hypothetical protein
VLGDVAAVCTESPAPLATDDPGVNGLELPALHPAAAPCSAAKSIFFIASSAWWSNQRKGVMRWAMDRKTA